MARYIDEKDVYKLVEPTGVARVHCSQIDELPRADVVPKSEVEKLHEVIFKKEDLMQEIAKERNEYADEVTRLTDDNEYLQDKVFKVRLEVAREIFEEIEAEITAALKSNYEARSVYNPTDEFGMWVQGKIDALRGIEDFIAELKKKRTEGENEES